MEAKIKDILNNIADKKDLYSRVAQLILKSDNQENAIQFIKECGEQIHSKRLQKHWGDTLIEEIKNFCQERGFINPILSNKTIILQTKTYEN
ncbi:MAG TPA: hypothetical protein VNZ49_15160 [Bacteroidia bacterium]|jgi:hypothetical protein|nr:hypothetical protein [Bacteroidia bacterium]